MRQKTIYFIVADGLDMVKIGCSCWVENRMEALSHWSPVPLRIAASAPGDHKLEAFIHRRFADDRSHKEWFRLSPAISNLIECLNDGANLMDLVGAQRVEPKSKMDIRGYRYVAVRSPAEQPQAA